MQIWRKRNDKESPVDGEHEWVVLETIIPMSWVGFMGGKEVGHLTFYYGS